MGIALFTKRVFFTNLIQELAGVVGLEPTVHGIKTRGYCYQELSGFS